MLYREVFDLVGCFSSRDCGHGTYTTEEAVNAVLGLEMPGPMRWHGQLLTHSLMSKKISQHTLDLRVREVLKLVSRVRKIGIERYSRDRRASEEHLRGIHCLAEE